MSTAYVQEQHLWSQSISPFNSVTSAFNTDPHAYSSESEDGQAAGGRKNLNALQPAMLPQPPSSDNLSQPAGKSVDPFGAQ